MWHLALSDDPSGKPLSSFMTMLLGVLALYMFYQESVIYIVTLALLVYPLMLLTSKMCRGRSGVAVGFVTLVYLLTWYQAYFSTLFVIDCFRCIIMSPTQAVGLYQ